MPDNPYAQYKKTNPYAVFSTPGTGPKPPSGYASPDQARPVVAIPGGSEDPRTIAAQEAARVGAAQAIQNQYEMRQIAAREALQAQLQAKNNQLPLGPKERTDLATTMRKELEGRGSVQVYKNALPSYASALKSPDTPAGDQDMIYAFAKIMDPNSVVREGEANSVANLGTMGQKIVGELQKQLGEGGKFTPELRAQLRNTLAGRMAEYDRAYNMDRAFFRDAAKKQGVDPELIVGPHLGDAYAAIENQYFRKDPNKSAAAARAEAAANSGQPGQGAPVGGAPLVLPGATPATGSTKAAQMDPKTAGLINGMIQNGYSADEINKILVPAGMIGPSGITQEAIDKARQTLRAGGRILPTYEQPTSFIDRAINSPGGTFVGSAFDAGMGGLSDELAGLVNGDTAGWNAAKQANLAANRKSGIAGQLVGGAGGMALGGAALKGTALAASLGRAAPYIGTTGFGAIEGAGQNNDERLWGATTGALLAGAGYPLGEAAAIPINAALRTRPGMAFSNATRQIAGRLPGIKRAIDVNPAEFAPGLSSAENLAASVITKGKPDTIKAQLDEAAQLGVPMSLADTSKRATLETANAVRRSPDAATFADNVLTPRARGQIDRFQQAVGRDLGPIENIPQLSADIQKGASVNAAPLYQKAYAAGQVDDPAINTLLTHPELRTAYEHGQQIHANDVLLAKALGDEPPPPLAEMTGPDGQYVPPDVRTLDYIKRGLDKRIDAAYSGDGQAKMNVDFLKDARNLLLTKLDTAVPDYAAARAAYGGPMQSKEALEFGKSAVSMDPNVLGVEAAKFSPEQMGQAQIGHRSGLVDQANKYRFSGNPFDLTLGNPAAEQRLATMHPNNPGVANLLRQRDLEAQLAKSQNRILGGSTTDENAIGSKRFLTPSVDAAVDIGSTVATGGVPVLPMAKLGFSWMKNAATLGAEKRAVDRATELAPIMLNTDPAAASATVDDIMQRLAARRQFEARQNLTRPTGMFGASAALAGQNSYWPF